MVRQKTVLEPAGAPEAARGARRHHFSWFWMDFCCIFIDFWELFLNPLYEKRKKSWAIAFKANFSWAYFPWANFSRANFSRANSSRIQEFKNCKKLSTILITKLHNVNLPLCRTPAVATNTCTKTPSFKIGVRRCSRRMAHSDPPHPPCGELGVSNETPYPLEI